MSIRTAKGTTAAPTYGFKDDTDTGLHSSAANVLNLSAGGSEIGEWSAGATPQSVVRLAVTGAAGSSGVFASLANPFGYDVVITQLVYRITTQSSGASTVDIGVGANATTSNDGLIDGLSSATAGTFSAAVNAGTNGRGGQVWTSSTFLNVAEASGDVNALVGVVYAVCAKLPV